jgi:hypothetical protein
VLEHLSHTLVGLGGALEVLRGANLLADILSLGILLVWRDVSLDVVSIRTCSGVTGFCDVLCSSSIVFWSYLKSILQPTRMMGRPEQKCMTSEYHCCGDVRSVLVREQQVFTRHAMST